MKLRIEMSEIISTANPYLPQNISLLINENNLSVKIQNVGTIILDYLRYENGNIYFKGLNKLFNIGLSSFLPENLKQYFVFGNKEMEVKIQNLVDEYLPEKYPFINFQNIVIKDGVVYVKLILLSS